MIAFLTSNSSNVIKVVRREMHSKNPHCFWCGILTYELAPFPNGVQMPWDRATIDHLGKRSDPFPQPVVLACNECNTWRSILSYMKKHPDNPHIPKFYEKYKQRLIMRSVYLKELQGELNAA